MSAPQPVTVCWSGPVCDSGDVGVAGHRPEVADADADAVDIAIGADTFGFTLDEAYNLVDAIRAAIAFAEGEAS